MTLDDILASHRTHRPVVVGILNVTPDSFSDAGQYMDPASAVARARRWSRRGPTLWTWGRSPPARAARVSADGQIARLAGVVEAVARLGVVLSVDTTRSAVARMALSAGATIVNDVSAGREDPAMFDLAARSGCGLVLMHMLGEPATMQDSPRYDDVVAEVREFLAGRLAAAQAAGVAAGRCIVDPGIGFGKTTEHNLTLLANLPALAELGAPIMVGVSRKRFIGSITGEAQADQRLPGSLAAACAAYRGGATLLRVHDVGPTAEAMKVLAGIERFRNG